MANSFYKKKNSRNYSTLKQQVTMFLIPLLSITLVYTTACIAAYIINVKQENYFIFSMGGLCLGCAAAGFITGVKKRRKGMIYAVLYSLPSIVLYAVISMIINSFKIDYTLIVSVVLPVIFSALGGIISVNMRTRPKVGKIGKRK